MKIIFALLFQITVIFIFTFTPAIAGGNHGGGGQPQSTRPPPPPTFDNPADAEVIKGKLVKVSKIKDYEVSVKVVDVNDSIPDGGSHNILVKINRDREIIRDGIVSVNVVFPDNSEKSKSLFELGDWYVAGFNMGQTGKHEIYISFNKKQGETHHMKVSYP